MSKQKVFQDASIQAELVITVKQGNDVKVISEKTGFQGIPSTQVMEKSLQFIINRLMEKVSHS